MKFNTSMPASLRFFYERELKKANDYLAKQQFWVSWRHLERAHILSQPYPVSHTFVHWQMLLFAFKTKNTKEIFGQIPRLVFGGIKSFVGKIPVGNTGGSDVPPLKPMKIPEDLQLIINKNKE